MKRMLAVVLSVLMAFSCMSMTAFAVDATMAPIMLAAGGTVDNFVGSDEDYAGSEYGWLTEGQLSSQDGSKDKDLGNGWNKYAINNPLGAAMGEDDIYRVWKLEIDGGAPQTAHLWFFNDNTEKYEEFDVTSFSTSGNGATALVIMPDGYRLVGGCFNPASGINANYAGRHAPENVGTVTVTADVDAWHNEITPNEYYERDVDKYYERTVDEYYERTVDEFYERTVDEYYERSVDKYYERNMDEYYERTVDEYFERPVTDIYQRYAQRYLIPVFEKKLEGAYNDTLVTRLKYSSDKADAKPVATYGGAFKNGHTYVTVNVAEASKEGGVWYTIADSSKNNGKKAPDQYNRPIDYTYNVKIEDGKLTVSFPENLAYASVGAEIWTTAPKDAKNAPKHYANTVTVDVPKNDGTVDLYVHLEKLGWYEVDEDGEYVYQFKEWRYDDSRTEYGDYELVDTKYGEYELVNTVNGEYELADTQYGDYNLADTQYGEYELADTEYGEYELADTQYGEYELVDTQYGEYELVDTQYGEYGLAKSENVTTRVEDVYTGSLTVTITGADGTTVATVTDFSQPLTLKPGEYTFTLSGDDFEAVTETVTIVAGQNDPVELTADVQNDDVTLATVEHHKDREATEHHTDKEAVRYEDDKTATRHEADKAATTHYADKEVTEHYADKAAEEHYADKAAEKHYANAEATQQYNQEYLYKDNIKLGNETDPDGEYAVKLN